MTEMASVFLEAGAEPEKRNFRSKQKEECEHGQF
jgi:hypothetical protein